MGRKHVNDAGHAKADLPQKTCIACARPFAWRRKWARDWDQVKFCSDRCRAAGALRPDATTGRGSSDPAG